MTDKYILVDKKVIPVDDLFEWGRWLEEHQDERMVDKTTIGKARVSTVFLGLDHSFGMGPPLLFETMVFGGKHDGDMERYSTWEEAKAGHKKMVKLVIK
jgi:hypothetical protein